MADNIFGQNFLPGVVSGLNAALDREQRQQQIDLQKAEFEFKRARLEQATQEISQFDQVDAEVNEKLQDRQAGVQIRSFASELASTDPKIAKILVKPQLERLRAQGIEIPKETIDFVINAKPGSQEEKVIQDLASQRAGGNEVLETLSNPEKTAAALSAANKRVSSKDLLEIRKQRAIQRVEDIDKDILQINRTINRLSQIQGSTESFKRIKQQRLSPLLSRREKLQSQRKSLEDAVLNVFEDEQEQLFQSEAREDQQQATRELQEDRQAFEVEQKGKRSKELQARGISKELADDISAGDVRVFGPDQFGKFSIINEATGVRSPVVDEDNVSISNILDEELQGRSLEEDVAKGTGPFAKIQAGISNVFGPFIEGAVFEDTTRARQNILSFRQFAKIGIVNNPRFPVAEQEQINRLLPNPDDFFIDPDTARSNLKELKSFLFKQKNAKESQIKGDITSKRKSELSDQISRLNELLSLVTTEKDNAISSQEDVDKLPSGTEFIWEPTGQRFVKE